MSREDAPCDPVCGRCDGFGYVMKDSTDDWATVPDTTTCPMCNGTGEP